MFFGLVLQQIRKTKEKHKGGNRKTRERPCSVTCSSSVFDPLQFEIRLFCISIFGFRHSMLCAVRCSETNPKTGNIQKSNFRKLSKCNPASSSASAPLPPLVGKRTLHFYFLRVSGRIIFASLILVGTKMPPRPGSLTGKRFQNI